MDRLIFHIDVNSAFLSWEAVRRISSGLDDIRLIPSAIGGDQEKRTGVILAKSIPAKAYGIQTGEPVAMALRKCPDLFLAKPDFSLYRQCSKSFIRICRQYAPVVEQISIDECFLDMSGTGRLYPDPVATAHAIKDQIYQELGFTVNVGISSCKLLAKMASDFEKPNKVHTLFPKEVPDKMWPMDVGSLFGVGNASAEKLRKAGIRTIGDLASRELRTLTQLTGPKMAEYLHASANGIDPSPVKGEPDEAKGYSISRTLEHNITSADAAYPVLLALADSLTARMRAEGAQAECVSVTIRSADFRNSSHQITLGEPTDIFKEVYDVSRHLFDELWDGHTPLRLLGISLTGIVRSQQDQLSLFSDLRREKARTLDRTYDRLQAKFGIVAITRGARIPEPHTDKKDPGTHSSK